MLRPFNKMHHIVYKPPIFSYFFIQNIQLINTFMRMWTLHLLIKKIGITRGRGRGCGVANRSASEGGYFPFYWTKKMSFASWSRWIRSIFNNNNNNNNCTPFSLELETIGRSEFTADVTYIHTRTCWCVVTDCAVWIPTKMMKCRRNTDNNYCVLFA